MEALTSDEAARMMGVSRRQFERYVYSGQILRGADGFDPNEVSVLKELKKKKLDLAEVANIAHRAHMEAYRACRELQILKDVIGLNIPTVELDLETVTALHTRVENLTMVQHLYRAEELIDWARIFLSLGEEYFEAITYYTQIQEPWWVYLELAGIMLKATSVDRRKIDLELQMAFDYLSTARPKLRATVFSRASQVYGSRKALKMFPDMRGTGHQSVLQVISANIAAKQDIQRG